MALQKAPWRDFGWLRGFVENENAHPTLPAVASFLQNVVWYWIWVLLTLPQFYFAFCGAGRIWGLDVWLGPTLVRWAPSGAGWARFLRLAA